MEFPLFEDVVVTLELGLKVTTVQCDDNVMIIHGANSMRNKKQNEAQDCYVTVLWLQERKKLNFGYKGNLSSYLKIITQRITHGRISILALACYLHASFYLIVARL
jgi:hypothetical protein